MNNDDAHAHTIRSVQHKGKFIEVKICYGAVQLK